MPANFKSFFRSIIAGSGGDNPGDQMYVEGNHVGSWDIMLDYENDAVGKFRAYHQTIGKTVRASACRTASTACGGWNGAPPQRVS